MMFTWAIPALQRQAGAESVQGVQGIVKGPLFGGIGGRKEFVLAAHHQVLRPANPLLQPAAVTFKQGREIL
jgi:hypothetical protein